MLEIQEATSWIQLVDTQEFRSLSMKLSNAIYDVAPINFNRRMKVFEQEMLTNMKLLPSG